MKNQNFVSAGVTTHNDSRPGEIELVIVRILGSLRQQWILFTTLVLIIFSGLMIGVVRNGGTQTRVTVTLSKDQSLTGVAIFSENLGAILQAGTQSCRLLTAKYQATHLKCFVELLSRAEGQIQVIAEAREAGTAERANREIADTIIQTHKEIVREVLGREERQVNSLKTGIAELSALLADNSIKKSGNFGPILVAKLYLERELDKTQTKAVRISPEELENLVLASPETEIRGSALAFVFSAALCLVLAAFATVLFLNVRIFLLRVAQAFKEQHSGVGERSAK
jgi:hypothetical protein